MTRVARAGLVGEILAAYVRVRVELHRRGVPAIVSTLRAAGQGTCPPADAGTFETWLVARRLANAIDRTLGPLPVDSRCLVQSLVLLRLLTARGISGTLVIGAQSATDFAAHAWLEHAGRPVQAPGEFAAARLVEM